MNNYEKYKKYKNKYLKKREQKGGYISISCPSIIEYYENKDINKKIIVIGDIHGGMDELCESEDMDIIMKSGITSQNIKKRVYNLQRSLLDNCNIIYSTDILIDCYFYKYLLKLILKNNSLRNDREFLNVEIDEIIKICFR